jgi:hypothetical protein
LLRFNQTAGLAGELHNMEGALFRITGNGDITTTQPGNNIVINAGILIIAGSGTSSVSVPFLNTGMVRLEQGTLQLSGSAVFTQEGPDALTLLGGGSLGRSGSTARLTQKADTGISAEKGLNLRP